MIAAAPQAEAAALAALWRAVELCLPSHRRCPAVTFRPAGAATLHDEWDSWTSAVFRPALDPAVEAVIDAAASGSPAAVLAADEALGAALPRVEAGSSLRAGRTALLDFEPPRGARLLERLRMEARADTRAGHLATVFVARGHAFHLPAVQLRAALLMAEAVLGAAGSGLTLPADAAAGLIASALHSAPGGAARSLAAV